MRNNNGKKQRHSCKYRHTKEKCNSVTDLKRSTETTTAVLDPRYTELVLTTFRKLLPNVLKLCSNWVDVVATFYSLFTNFLDRLERDGCSRTLSLLKIFCRPSRPVIRRSDNVFKTRWTYYKRNCRTSILFGTCYDVVQSGINWKYVCKPTHPFVARFPRSQSGTIRPTASLVHRYSDQTS